MGDSVKWEEFNLLRAELILGKPAPEFSHTSVYGTPVSLKDLRSKVVVLYYWSTRDGRTVRKRNWIQRNGESIKITKFILVGKEYQYTSMMSSLISSYATDGGPV